jgi:peptide-methionine (S)-S-oxide reductase
MGGDTLNPTYKKICMGDTNHAEVVRVNFNPKMISYIDLLDVFWENHNPTTLNQQGPDVGTQYRSVIFYYSDLQKVSAEKSMKDVQSNYSTPIVTQIMPKDKFYRAEEYHQNYLNKNNLESCGL